jgi:hypothetical protein
VATNRIATVLSPPKFLNGVYCILQKAQNRTGLVSRPVSSSRLGLCYAPALVGCVQKRGGSSTMQCMPCGLWPMKIIIVHVCRACRLCFSGTPAGREYEMKW